MDSEEVGWSVATRLLGHALTNARIDPGTSGSHLPRRETDITRSRLKTLEWVEDEGGNERVLTS